MTLSACRGTPPALTDFPTKAQNPSLKIWLLVLIIGVSTEANTSLLQNQETFSLCEQQGSVCPSLKKKNPNAAAMQGAACGHGN